MSSSLDFTIKLTDRVTAPLKRVQAQFKSFNATAANSFKKIGGGAVALYAVTKSIAGLISPAEEMDRALKNASLGGVSSINELHTVARKFAAEYGTSAIDFVNSTSLIKSALSGISDRDVPHTIAAINMLSKATGENVETSTAYIEKMASSYKRTVNKIGQLNFARHVAGIAAYAKSNFNVSSQQLQSMMQSTKYPAANGVSMEEQSVVLGMASKNLGSGAVGSYAALYENMTKAGKELGLSFADVNGKMLSMPEIIAKIQGKFGKDLSKNIKAQKMLDKAFGAGADIVKVLSNNSNEFNRHMKEIGKGQNFKLMQKMALANVKALDRINAQFTNIKESISRALMPVLTPIMDTISKVIGKFGKWMEMFPNIAKWLGIITVAIMSLAAVAAVFAIISGVVSLLLSPIMLIVLAIGAVIAISFVLRKLMISIIIKLKNMIISAFSTVIEFIGEFWNSIKNTWIIQTLIAGFKFLFDSVCAVWNSIGTAFNNMVKWISDIWDLFVDFFTNFSFIESFSKVGESLVNMFSRVWKTIKNAGIAVINTIIDGLNYIPGVNIKLLEYEKIDEPIESPIGSDKSPLTSTSVRDVEPGGLSKEIQNSKSQNIDNSKNIQSVTINNAQPMTPAQLQEWEQIYAG